MPWLEHGLLSPEVRLLLQSLSGLSPHDHFWLPVFIILWTELASIDPQYSPFPVSASVDTTDISSLKLSSCGCHVVYSLRSSVLQTLSCFVYLLMVCCSPYLNFLHSLLSLPFQSQYIWSLPFQSWFTNHFFVAKAPNMRLKPSPASHIIQPCMFQNEASLVPVHFPVFFFFALNDTLVFQLLKCWLSLSF